MERGNRPPPPPLPLLFSGGGPRANAAAADRGAIGRRGSGIEMTEGKVAAAAADDDDGGLGEPGTPLGNKVIYRAEVDFLKTWSHISHQVSANEVSTIRNPNFQIFT